MAADGKCVSFRSFDGCIGTADAREHTLLLSICRALADSDGITVGRCVIDLARVYAESQDKQFSGTSTDAFCIAITELTAAVTARSDAADGLEYVDIVSSLKESQDAMFRFGIQVNPQLYVLAGIVLLAARNIQQRAPDFDLLDAVGMALVDII